MKPSEIAFFFLCSILIVTGGHLLANHEDTRPAIVKSVEDSQNYVALKALRTQAQRGDVAALVDYFEHLVVLSKTGDVTFIIEKLKE